MTVDEVYPRNPFTIRLTEQTIDALHRIARSKSKTASGLTREVIQAYIKNNEVKK